MSSLRETAQQALEVLVRASSYYDTYAEIAALEAALAEPVQEPVAWLDEEINCAYTPEELDGGTADGLVPLYTAPPQRKPLNEDQMNEAYIYIWRNLPDGFDHTASAWIETAIRYAERAHGIGGEA